MTGATPPLPNRREMPQTAGHAANRRGPAKDAAMIPARDWYECIPFADGITLIHKPWMAPFYR